MHVDLGNCLAEVAEPGISRAGLDGLDEEVAAAHERIEAGRAAGEFGYVALDLPERTDPDAIRAAVEPFADADAVLTVGIGGSALGASTVVDALAGGGRGARGPDDGVAHHALDNVDPAHTRALLDALPLSDTAVHVVSKSGTTAETLANFLVVREAMDDAGVDWTERTMVTTGDSGPLRELAERHDLTALSVPEGVPGRFSALSTMGLVPAAIAGVDLDALLDGAAAEGDRLTGSLYDSPAYAYGAVATALARDGAVVNAMMPYAESLETFAEWFAQLWAESLGKEGLGQTPVRALGATDQHSQLQLYRAGRRNTLVSLVRPRERPACPVPEPESEALSYLGGTDLGELLDAEFEATEASLAAAGRPSIRIEVERIDETGLGGLLYGMEAACIMAAELQDFDAFDQPAVEWGKQAARDLLRGADTERSRAVRDRSSLPVE